MDSPFEIVLVRSVVPVPCHHIEWRVAQSPCKEPASVFGQNRKVTLAILVPSYGGKEVSREREAVNPDRTVIGQGEVPVVNLEDVSYRSNRSVSESDKQTYRRAEGSLGRRLGLGQGPSVPLAARCLAGPRRSRSAPPREYRTRWSRSANSPAGTAKASLSALPRAPGWSLWHDEKIAISVAESFVHHVGVAAVHMDLDA